MALDFISLHCLRRLCQQQPIVWLFALLWCASVNSHAQVLFSEDGASSGVVADHSGDIFAIGQTWFDVNLDGWADLFLTNQNGPNRLFINQGAAPMGPRFIEVDPGPARLPNELSTAASSADFDNDGRPDLLVLTQGRPFLFRNTLNGLVDVTSSSGLNHIGRGQSATWADLNDDGWLDVYIANWFFAETESHPNSQDHLYLSTGPGRFRDVSYLLDLPRLHGPGFASLFVDYDNDGDSDLYVVNDKLYGNQLWRHDGIGCGGICFTNVSQETGAIRPVWGMGISAADMDLDGDLDLYFTSIGELVMLRNELIPAAGVGPGTPLFTEVTDLYGVNASAIGWGAMFADWDNNGYEDIYVPTAFPGETNRLFMNDGGAPFRNESASSGTDLAGFSISLAIADLNQDGLLDMVVGNRGEAYHLFQNQSQGTGAWVQLRVLGGGDLPTEPVGTRVYLQLSNGLRLQREVFIGGSMGVSHEPILHFGIGEAQIQSMQVVWSNGMVENLPPPAINQRVELFYPGRETIAQEGFEGNAP